MFRHMLIPRDTSALREIICESVGNCQTLSKDGPSQLVNNIIFLLFFSFYPMTLLSYMYLFLSRSEVRPRVLYIMFMFIHRQLFKSRDIQSSDCIVGFHRKGLSWIVWPSVRILSTYNLINCEWFVIKLFGIGIILLSDLLCGVTSYYFSIDLRFDCIFKNSTRSSKWTYLQMTDNISCFKFKSLLY